MPHSILIIAPHIGGRSGSSMLHNFVDNLRVFIPYSVLVVFYLRTGLVLAGLFLLVGRGSVVIPSVSRIMVAR